MDKEARKQVGVKRDRQALMAADASGGQEAVADPKSNEEAAHRTNGCCGIRERWEVLNNIFVDLAL